MRIFSLLPPCTGLKSLATDSGESLPLGVFCDASMGGISAVIQSTAATWSKGPNTRYTENILDGFFERRAGGIWRRLHHHWWCGTDQDSLGHALCPVAADVAGNFTARCSGSRAPPERTFGPQRHRPIAANHSWRPPAVPCPNPCSINCVPSFVVIVFTCFFFLVNGLLLLAAFYLR